MSQDPVPRAAARVLLVDAAGRVLLVRFYDPAWGRSWWAAPGGGLDPGESYEAAARREVREETGLDGFELGPWVWSREHVFPWQGVTWRQRERFFLALVPAFDPRSDGFTADENELLRGHRWWSAAEIEGSAELFSPRRLGSLLRSLLEAGPPPAPLEVGL